MRTAALVLIGALTAASPPAQPATGEPTPLIRIPAGWREVLDAPTNVTGLGLWEKPIPTGTQSINVRFIAKDGAGVVSIAQLAGEFAAGLKANAPGGFHVIVIRPQTLCDHSAGWELRYVSGKRASSKDVTLVMAPTLGYVYFATYERTASSHDSTEALASVRSLCPVAQARAFSVAPILAPSGWTPVTTAMRLPHWAWAGPSAGNSKPAFIEAQVIPQVRRPSQSELLSRFTRGVSSSSARYRLVDRRPIVLCNGATGTFVHLASTSTAPATHMYAVLSANSLNQFYAVYVRRDDQPEQAEALQAIESLCPSQAVR